MEFRLSDQTLAFSVDVARATMGVDALYRRETGFTDLHDGLVVLNMANVEPAAYESYQAAQSHLAELAQKALALPEPDRRLYYAQACTSLWSFCQWRQDQLPSMSSQKIGRAHV